MTTLENQLGAFSVHIDGSEAWVTYLPLCEVHTTLNGIAWISLTDALATLETAIPTTIHLEAHNLHYCMLRNEHGKYGTKIDVEHEYNDWLRTLPALLEWATTS